MSIKAIRPGSEIAKAVEALGIDLKSTRRVVIDLRSGEFPEIAVYRTGSDEDLASLISKIPPGEVMDLP